MVDTAPELLIARGIRLHAILGVGLIVAILGGLVLWSANTEIAGAVVAPGAIMVEGGSKRIQHAEGGIVAEIHVRNGDSVKAGDLLVRLDGTAVAASLGVVSAQLDDAFARKARLLAESEGTEILSPISEKDWPATPSFARSLDEQQRLLSARMQSLTSQRSRLSEQTTQLDRQIDGFQAQQQALKEQLGILTEEWQGLSELYDKKLTDAERTNTNRRERADLEGQIAQIDAQVAGARAAIAEHQVQAASLLDDLEAQSLDDLQQVNVNIAQFLQQKIAAEDRLRRLDIRAPQAGVVDESVIETIGGVVTPGETLMLIVPEQTDVVAEVRVSPADVDKVHSGQDVSVRFPGLDPRQTPELAASIRTVEPTAATDPKTGVGYYDVRVPIPQTELNRLHDIRLIPGMPVEVFAQTGDRTVLAYLLKPLMDQVLHTFRED